MGKQIPSTGAIRRQDLIADHDQQRRSLRYYAVCATGPDWEKIQVVDAGTPEQMMAAFRAGVAFVHLQGGPGASVARRRANRTDCCIGRRVHAAERPARFSFGVTSIGSPAFKASRRPRGSRPVGARLAEELRLREASLPWYWGQAALTSAIVQEHRNWEGGIEPA